jgi:hypothetical protein
VTAIVTAIVFRSAGSVKSWKREIRDMVKTDCVGEKYYTTDLTEVVVSGEHERHGCQLSRVQFPDHGYPFRT